MIKILCYNQACKQKKSNSFGYHLYPLLLIKLSILMFIGINFANATISASTKATILGHAPNFVLSDGLTELKNLDELLGFTMPVKNSVSGEIEITKINSSASSNTLIAITGTKFSDIKALVKADNQNYQLSTTELLLSDIDGDADQMDDNLSKGTLKGVWFNQRGNVVDNLEQPLSSCDGPYTLFIVANSVSANTTYGNPSANNYGSGTAIYSFTVDKPEICYIKPLDLSISSTGTTIPGGYNQTVFDTTKGFIVSGLKHENISFPKTGFKGSEFTLIGTGSDQSKYRCSIQNDTGVLSLSGSGSTYAGQNCNVRYEGDTRFDYPITIDMEYYDGTTWSKIDSYTIPKPTLWAVRSTEMAYANQDSFESATLFPALSTCSGENVTSINDDVYINRQKYLFRRNEFTNSTSSDPINYPEGTSPTITNSQFSRDADGTFMGEWGLIYRYDYSSGNQLIFYWTAETYSANAQFNIGTSGNVYPTSPSATYPLVICRG